LQDPTQELAAGIIEFIRGGRCASQPLFSAVRARRSDGDQRTGWRKTGTSQSRGPDSLAVQVQSSRDLARYREHNSRLWRSLVPAFAASIRSARLDLEELRSEREEFLFADAVVDVTKIEPSFFHRIEEQPEVCIDATLKRKTSEQYFSCFLMAI
jgi:hypothetical protein